MKGDCLDFVRAGGLSKSDRSGSADASACSSNQNDKRIHLIESFTHEQNVVGGFKESGMRYGNDVGRLPSLRVSGSGAT